MLLAGKVAIVTGAGSGIGRASALRFAVEGTSVVAADLRGPKVEETVTMIEQAGGVAAPIVADVADAADAERMVATAIEAFGRLDALFNNAGTIGPGTAVKLSQEDWDLVMAVNVRSVFLGAEFTIPGDGRGRRAARWRLSTASVSGLSGDPGNVVYSASKAAVVDTTRSLAIDHAPRWHPRQLHLSRRHRHTAHPRRARRCRRPRPRAERAHPLGRLGRPEDIAAAAVWLCSDESSWITGHALLVDGGLTAQSHVTGMADPRPAHLRLPV